MFITDNFLLQSDSAIRLYHEFAKEQPIIDYHCHLSPKEVAEDRRFENLTQIWLAGDHYKWRAMRAAGVNEEYITGNASDWEKFQAWAETVPKTLRNPLYHWTHLELNRPFGISDKLLCPATAKAIWDECNAKLSQPEFSARGIMRQMNVKLVCTTDDPADDLRWHKKIAADKSFDIQVLPTFRPDKAVQVGEPTQGIHITENSISNYSAYIDKLGEAAGVEIKTYDNLLEALNQRYIFFHENGCRLSDHGFGLFYFVLTPQEIAAALFQEIRSGKTIADGASIPLQSAILQWCGMMDSDRGWTMQLHIGAIRNNNSRMFAKLGADAGFDSIVDGNLASALSRFFDTLDSEESLPKTIVYNLNPTANEMLTTMIGNFQGYDKEPEVKRSGTSGGQPKMQFGSGWWFLDQKDGMERQLNCLSNLGLLSGFVGMLTDSRSFLSYTRHEYFRRILCNLLGQDMKDGLIPADYELVGNVVKNICYCNAKDYFGFDLK